MKAKPGNTQIKNLDVLGLDREPKLDCVKGAAGEVASEPHISVVSPYPAQPKSDSHHRHKRHYRTGPSKYVTVAQATNIIEGVDFAKLISPLGCPI